MSLDTSDNNNNTDGDVGVSGRGWEKLGTELQREGHRKHTELDGDGEKWLTRFQPYWNNV